MSGADFTRSGFRAQFLVTFLIVFWVAQLGGIVKQGKVVICSGFPVQAQKSRNLHPGICESQSLCLKTRAARQRPKLPRTDFGIPC